MDVVAERQRHCCTDLISPAPRQQAFDYVSFHLFFSSDQLLTLLLFFGESPFTPNFFFFLFSLLAASHFYYFLLIFSSMDKDVCEAAVSDGPVEAPERCAGTFT